MEAGFKFDLKNYRSDLESTRLKILSEIGEYVSEIRSNYKSIEDQNNSFISYFGSNLRRLYEYSENDPKNPGSSTIKERTFTKDVIETFIKWNKTYREDKLGEFFGSTKSKRIDLPNILELQQKHLMLFKRMPKNESNYIDLDLLKNPDLKKLYEVSIHGYLYKEMMNVASNWRFSETLIKECLDHFEKQIDDDFSELRKTKNKFNEMPIAVLIDLFKVLLKTAIGQSKPIISKSDFNRFIKSICENKLLDTAIEVNLSRKDLSTIRRQFYEFYCVSRANYDIKQIKKREYLKFIENFKPFVGKAQSKDWIDQTTSRNQKTTLNQIVID